MLFEQLKQKLIKVTLVETDDGYGGISRTWTESSDQFDAYIQRISSVDRQIANQANETATYYITTSASDALRYHDTVKRVSDGAYFRVLSDGLDAVSPCYMAYVGNMSQVTAERWDIDG